MLSPTEKKDKRIEQLVNETNNLRQQLADSQNYASSFIAEQRRLEKRCESLYFALNEVLQILVKRNG